MALADSSAVHHMMMFLVVGILPQLTTPQYVVVESSVRVSGPNCILGACLIGLGSRHPA
jgi:hypothetical protein